MEMVGDWNSRGRGESLPRRSKLSGDASVTELTLPCAFVRKRGLPDSRFLCITHAATYTRARTRTRTRTPSRSPPPVPLPARRPARPKPFSTLVAASWTFPLDSRDTALGAVTRALRCRSIPLVCLSFFPSCSRVRLLPTYQENRLPLFVSEKKIWKILCALDSFVIPHRLTLD